MHNISITVLRRCLKFYTIEYKFGLHQTYRLLLFLEITMLSNVCDWSLFSLSWYSVTFTSCDEFFSFPQTFSCHHMHCSSIEFARVARPWHFCCPWRASHLVFLTVERFIRNSLQIFWNHLPDSEVSTTFFAASCSPWSSVYLDLMTLHVSVAKWTPDHIQYHILPCLDISKAKHFLVLAFSQDCVFRNPCACVKKSWINDLSGWIFWS